MKFEKRSDNKYVAQGDRGLFVIEKMYGLWVGMYFNHIRSFSLPSKKTIEEAQIECMNNPYWEHESSCELGG